MQDEIWIDIPNYEGIYQVSNFGKIKSLPREYKNQYGGTGKFSKERIMKPSDNRVGYLCLSLCKGGKIKYHYIHHLVLNSFVEKPFNNAQCNHKNGNKHDNKLENLEWCSPSENINHAYKNGLIRGKNARNISR